ncbi:MAG: hypothetical protein IPN43_07720 [Chitinophagaceae bacterium]|nr:hypothetical protein [Chitinophagaceae bacterium]
MNTLNINCGSCGIPMVDPHGNMRYHSDCAYIEKKKTSKAEYARKSKQANPTWANEKILREHFFRNRAAHDFEPDDLEAAGLDFTLYSEERNVAGTIIYCMRKFGFSFLQNKNCYMQTLITAPKWESLYLKSYPPASIMSTPAVPKIDEIQSAGGTIPWVTIGVVVVVVCCTVYLINQHRQEIERRRQINVGMR